MWQNILTSSKIQYGRDRTLEQRWWSGLGSSCFNDLYSDSILQPELALITAKWRLKGTWPDWSAVSIGLLFSVSVTWQLSSHTPAMAIIYVRPFRCCVSYLLWAADRSGLFGLLPLHNTLLWAAPGGFQHYLFLHIIALSCLNTTLRTNYPDQGMGGIPTCLLNHSKLIIPIPEKRSIKSKKQYRLLRFVGGYFVPI